MSTNKAKLIKMTFCVKGTFLRLNDYSAKHADSFTSD